MTFDKPIHPVPHTHTHTHARTHIGSRPETHTCAPHSVRLFLDTSGEFVYACLAVAFILLLQKCLNPPSSLMISSFPHAATSRSEYIGCHMVAICTRVCVVSAAPVRLH